VAAGTVPGGVLAVQLCFQVFYALSFLGARAVSMAALPQLAEAAVAQDDARFAEAWRQCLYYAVLVSLPPLFLLATFAGPTADLLANGELRQSSLINELAACLAVVACAQLVGASMTSGGKRCSPDSMTPALEALASSLPWSALAWPAAPFYFRRTADGSSAWPPPFWPPRPPRRSPCCAACAERSVRKHSLIFVAR
jgi:hypothetical protein